MPSAPSSPGETNCAAKPAGAGHVLTVLQVAVTLGLLWWLFHDPHRRAVMGEALRTADWRWMILAVAAAGVCELFGILRWQLFLRMLHIEVPLMEITRLFFIGAFFNQFLPGTTGGDVVRVIYLMRDHPEHKTEGFLSVAVDRLLAVLVLVVMGLLFAWTRDDWFARSFAVGNMMKWFAITLFVMGAFLIGSFVLTSRHLINRLPPRFPFRRQVVKMSTVWQLCLENRREALLGTLYTVPMLLAYFAAFCFAAKAFTAKVSIWDMTSIMPLVTAVSSLPLSLNGIGPREALLDNALTDLCGVPPGTGMIISIAGMAVYLLWGLVGGYFYLERIKRRYRAV
ncbi:MAG TPA: lysylphosphatidylglycerol synthase transmembrane domain-containing protein [Terrimicrobiaceae bacterium]|nr:lysylphosphatidylglycerol synthase transmembrane domain-containing protein [Terrimicrobiaceae bacterium]